MLSILDELLLKKDLQTNECFKQDENDIIEDWNQTIYIDI